MDIELVGNACLIIAALAVFVAAAISALRGGAWFLGLNGFGKALLVTLTVVLAVVGVLIRVKVDAQREPVFAVNARTWAQTPLVVRATAEIDMFSRQLDHAIAMWNGELGCPVFVRVQPAAVEVPHPDVRVIFLTEAPCGVDAAFSDLQAAAATYYCPGNTADIEVGHLDDVRVAYRLFAHELGHVLGLAHDPAGLMAATITTASLEEQVVPTPKDRKALAARYCAGAR